MVKFSTSVRSGRKSATWITFLLPTLIPLLLLPTPLRAVEISLEIGASSYRVEVASTPEDRRLGLMHRRELAPNRGMLLAYSTEGDHRVWMKNMLIPLRVFWIDAQHRIIHGQRLEPCAASPCATYAAPRASRFILELSDREHAIGVGDQVRGLSGL